MGGGGGSVVGVVVVTVGRVVGVVRGGDGGGGDEGAVSWTGGTATNAAGARVVAVVRDRRDLRSLTPCGGAVVVVVGAAPAAAATWARVVVVVGLDVDAGTVASVVSAFTSLDPARGSVPIHHTPATMSASATKSSIPLRNCSSGFSRRIRRTSLRTAASLSAPFTRWPCGLSVETPANRDGTARTSGGISPHARDQVTSARPISVSKLPL